MDTFRLGLDGSAVTLRLVNIKGFDIPLKYDTPSPFYAHLLHDTLYREMGGMFEEIRSKAYQQGWKDARAKRKICDWFSSAFGR